MPARRTVPDKVIFKRDGSVYFGREMVGQFFPPEGTGPLAAWCFEAFDRKREFRSSRAALSDAAESAAMRKRAIEREAFRFCVEKREFGLTEAKRRAAERTAQ